MQICVHVHVVLYLHYPNDESSHGSIAGYEKIVKCFDFHYMECFSELTYGMVCKGKTKEERKLLSIKEIWSITI